MWRTEANVELQQDTLGINTAVMPFPTKYSDIIMWILWPEIASTSVWYNFIYHTSIDCAGQQEEEEEEESRTITKHLDCPLVVGSN